VGANDPGRHLAGHTRHSGRSQHPRYAEHSGNAGNSKPRHARNTPGHARHAGKTPGRAGNSEPGHARYAGNTGNTGNTGSAVSGDAESGFAIRSRFAASLAISWVD
jgi:hypothetical protein